MSQPQLADYLIKDGIISKKDCDLIFRECGHKGSNFVKVLLMLGIMDEERVVSYLHEKTFLPFIDSKNFIIEPAAASLIDIPLVEWLEILPFSLKDQKLHIALIDPTDQNVLRQIKFFYGKKISPVIASYSTVQAGLSNLIRGYKTTLSPIAAFISEHKMKNVSNVPRNPAMQEVAVESDQENAESHSKGDEFEDELQAAFELASKDELHESPEASEASEVPEASEAPARDYMDESSSEDVSELESFDSNISSLEDSAEEINQIKKRAFIDPNGEEIDVNENSSAVEGFNSSENNTESEGLPTFDNNEATFDSMNLDAAPAQETEDASLSHESDSQVNYSESENLTTFDNDEPIFDSMGLDAPEETKSNDDALDFKIASSEAQYEELSVFDNEEPIFDSMNLNEVSENEGFENRIEVSPQENSYQPNIQTQILDLMTLCQISFDPLDALEKFSNNLELLNFSPGCLLKNQVILTQWPNGVGFPVEVLTDLQEGFFELDEQCAYFLKTSYQGIDWEFAFVSQNGVLSQDVIRSLKELFMLVVEKL